MDDIEKKVKVLLSEDIELPPSYKYIIRNTLKDRNVKKIHKKNKMLSTFATACATLIFITSIVYAKEIVDFVHYFFNRNNAIDSAIEHGYIDKPNSEYIGAEDIKATDNEMNISAEKTEIKVENMLMDDYTLNFTFSIKLDKNINVEEVSRIWFPKMIITDENNKILYSSDRQIFDNYCKDNKLNYDYGIFGENHMNSGLDSYAKSKSKSDNEFKIIYNFVASVHAYPKSRKLYINVKEIDLSRRNDQDADIILTGDWNIELDVAEKFYNRQAVVYNVKSCSDEKINVTEACVYNTGMVLEFTSKDKAIWSDDDLPEVQTRKGWEFGKYLEELDSKGIHMFIGNQYIKNERGEIFRPVKDGMEVSGTSYEYNGNFLHWQTFDLLTKDATDNMTIYIDLYLHEYERTVVIELERIR